MADDLICDSGQIAISDMITAINERISDTDYATELIGGTLKVKLDESDPSNITLFITNDGSTPGV